MRPGVPIRLVTAVMIVQALFAPAFGSRVEEPYGTYISTMFARYGMELPRLAWVVPPRTVVAPQKAPALWVWSEAESLVRAEYRGKVTPAELRDFRRTEGIACSRSPEIDRYELSKPVDPPDEGAPESGGNPVLYTTRSEVRIVSGAVVSETSSEELGRAARLFSIPDRATRSKGIDVTAGEYVYTFAGFYEEESGEMFASGLVLSSAKDRKTIGSKSWDVSPDTVCEGCDVPTFDDPLEDDFGVLNVIRLPHFPYPLLLEESSTDDEDALSLVTFSPKAGYSEYRVYESTEGCDELLGPPPVVAGSGRSIRKRPSGETWSGGAFDCGDGPGSDGEETKGSPLTVAH